MNRSVVSQRWPIAGNGELLLTLLTDTPDADAITLLEPVIEAIEAYQRALQQRHAGRAAATSSGKHHRPEIMRPVQDITSETH